MTSGSSGNKRELVRKARVDARAVEKGADPDDARALTRKPSNIFKIPETFHIYLKTIPGLTWD